MKDNFDKIVSQNRNLKFWNAATIIGLLIALVILFSWNNNVEEDIKDVNEKSFETASEILSKKTENLADNEDEEEGLDLIEVELQKLINTSASISQKESLLDLKNQVRNLSKLKNQKDSIKVYYYLRQGDKSNIVETIKNISSNQYSIEIEVPDNYETALNNTVYFGKHVPMNVVDTLVNALRTNGTEISNVKPFIMGYINKENSIEIGYQEINLNTIKNNKYKIKLYSHKPDALKKNIIGNTLANNGFDINVLPDWKEEMSFFPDNSQIFYYNIENKAKAIAIADSLQKATGIEFKIKQSDSFGVLNEKKRDFFIIFYLGV